MPPPLSADRPAAQPPQRGTVDALISQTRRLRGDVDAVRREAPEDGVDAESRWQRALCELALHQLDDLDEHLAQLRDGPPPAAVPSARTGADPALSPAPPTGSLLSRVGSAEWNLLTDEATWSTELYQILGRPPSAPALTLDELPSLVHDEDRPLLAAMVTDCLIEGKPIDGEFRVLRPDDDVRIVHMMGEPVLDADGSTASMWAVLRDVSELRRCRRTVRETRDSLRDHRHHARSGHRLAVEPQEAAPPPRPGPLRLPRRGPGALDPAARRLPATTSAPSGGDWYDTLELPDGDILLGIGDLVGHGPAVASGAATAIGALRGMAVAGTEPGRLMGWLNRLSDASVQPYPGAAAPVQPYRGTALCCRYRPGTRTLSWAQAGHPAPLLFRDGTGRVLARPDGMPLGATPHATYGQAEETLEEGDLLLLHTAGLLPRRGGTAVVRRLLELAPRLGATRSAQHCVRTVVEEFGASERQEGACVLVVRVVS
ncbi:PP2C family protein-serine/threonine phosphatase [Streptomyces sp. NPDC007264]|uniref:PP2C family protein-serine/threonine phosphatase n=1 Tax=Streptomyces sp. NPDC007264 TaxID=3364777 RepID=UPI0036DECBFF